MGMFSAYRDFVIASMFLRIDPARFESALIRETADEHLLRDALLENPNVAEALQQVAAEGWTEEARLHAESALAALKPPEEHSEQVESGDKHVMVSYQWDHQATVRRIVNELQARGYRTWFGAPKSALRACSASVALICLR